MKKIYQTPVMLIVALKGCAHLLQSSPFPEAPKRYEEVGDTEQQY